MDQPLDASGGELKCTSEQWDEMVEQVNRLAPEEACGLLAGRGAEVSRVYPVTNILHSPVRFRMDPSEQLKVFSEIDQREWELVGIYHSHPEGPDHPSMTDLYEAYYPDAVFLILFPDRGTWRCRGFRIRNGESHEVVVRMGISGMD